MLRESAVAAMETVPSQDALEESGESYFSVYYPEPTQEEMLAAYITYRSIGGEPYEPYESLLGKQAQSLNGNGKC
jgi:hypothetical protein